MTEPDTIKFQVYSGTGNLFAVDGYAIDTLLPAEQQDNLKQDGIQFLFVDLSKEPVVNATGELDLSASGIKSYVSL